MRSLQRGTPRLSRQREEPRRRPDGPTEAGGRLIEVELVKLETPAKLQGRRPRATSPARKSKADPATCGTKVEMGPGDYGGSEDQGEAGGKKKPGGANEVEG